MNDKTPDYLKIPIPSLQRQFGYRSTNIETIFCKIGRYLKSFFPDSVIVGNGISQLLRGGETLSIFKTNFLKVIRQVKKAYSIFTIKMVLCDFSN